MIHAEKKILRRLSHFFYFFIFLNVFTPKLFFLYEPPVFIGLGGRRDRELPGPDRDLGAISRTEIFALRDRFPGGRVGVLEKICRCRVGDV